MIKAIIVDDEQNAIKNLKWEIENFCQDVEVCDAFTNPVEAISAINYLKPDCVFLDIEMPEMDGFQLLSSLKYRGFDLIITTAFDNYAIKAFKEHAIDYLLKPIDSDDLSKSVERVRANKSKNDLGFEIKKVIESITPKTERRRIAIPLSGKTIFVESHEIRYCKSSGNYSEIYFTNHKTEVLSKKLKEVEELINDTTFFRVHNSYLVNINYIKEFVKSDGQYIVLEDGKTIPVSRSKKHTLMQALNG
ncbi:MAG: LytTR family DNA-binding domain-containing protein [Bacteroidia bacterium]|nr:LytTR family DNA-binding domain-containing protein [Bacteroidia bacterium]NND50801.1 response regulator transcription factor [Flavobacteriaceae bacterium]